MFNFFVFLLLPHKRLQEKKAFFHSVCLIFFRSRIMQEEKSIFSLSLLNFLRINQFFEYFCCCHTKGRKKRRSFFMQIVKFCKDVSVFFCYTITYGTVRQVFLNFFCQLFTHTLVHNHLFVFRSIGSLLC